MAKHRQIPQHSLHGRTVIGGVLASGALLVGAPGGMAFADHGTDGMESAEARRSSTSSAVTQDAPKPEARTSRAFTQDAAPKVTAQPALRTLKAKLTPEKRFGQFINTHITGQAHPGATGHSWGRS